MINSYVNQISQNYGGTEVFRDLSVEIKTGERIGLVGRNGEGKTTLARIFAGEEQPTSGEVGWRKGISKAMLAQIPNHRNQLVQNVLEAVFEELIKKKDRMEELESNLSGKLNEVVLEKTLEEYGRVQQEFMETGGYEFKTAIRRVSAGIGVTDLLDKEWHSLSGGERTKVGLAKLLLKRPDLLVLDEPTNHLDLYALDWLAEWLKQYDGSVLLISHDRAFLDATVSEIWELENGILHEYKTNYSGYVIEREERVLKEFQQYTNQQKKINKMKETIKRLKEWANRANPPNASMHRQAKSMEKALGRIEKLKKPIQSKKVDLVFNQQKRTGNDVFALSRVSKGFGEKQVLQSVNFVLKHQEKIGIVGRNGSGKSTLLQLLLGKLIPDSGEIKTGTNVSIGYLSQHVHELDSKQTVVNAFRMSACLSEEEARAHLAKFLFYGFDVYKHVEDLSGGEKMRLRLAQLMYEKHNVLIFDEPTNHLDIDSKEVLEEALNEFPGSVIAVSHDRYFLNKLFPVTYWIEDGAAIRYKGSFAYAERKRKA